jgi:hypothetical protein
MTSIHRTFLAGAALALAATAFCGESQAIWGHHRIVTSYSVPSVPVYSPPVVVERPVVVAPAFTAPVVVSRPVISAPVVSAPVAVSRPVVSTPVVVASPVVSAPVTTSTFVPAPQTTYYVPAAAPVVQQTVVSRPALFGPRVRTTYYAPSVVVPAPVIVP